MVVLTEKLADMHAGLYGYERTITDDDLAQFIKIEYARVGNYLGSDFTLLVAIFTRLFPKRVWIRWTRTNWGIFNS